MTRRLNWRTVARMRPSQREEYRAAISRRYGRECAEREWNGLDGALAYTAKVREISGALAPEFDAGYRERWGTLEREARECVSAGGS